MKKPNNMKESWWEVIQPYTEKSEWKAIMNTLANIHPNYCPEKKDIFNCFSHFEFQDTKVVFLLLSPYQRAHKKTRIRYATGLAAGVPDQTYDTPTLRIIRESLAIDCHELMVEEVFDWTLEHWAKQGVLLLNTALTVELNGNPKGHCKVWEYFIGGIIYQITKQLPNVILVPMGTPSKDLIKKYRWNLKNLTIGTCHPVKTQYELGANGQNWDKIPDKYNFLTYKVFKTVNEMLVFNKIKPIQWVKS